MFVYVENCGEGCNQGSAALLCTLFEGMKEPIQEMRIPPFVIWVPRWHSGSDAVLQIGRLLVRSQMMSLDFSLT